MAQQIISLGSGPNTKTGTPARVAGQIINSNFTELYDAMQNGGNNFNTFTEITLSDLDVATFAEVTDVIVQDYIDSLGITQLEGETNYFKVVEIPPVPPQPNYNFDVTASWGDIDTEGLSVTDEASFTSFLIAYSNFTNIVITDFSLVDNRLRCSLTANGTWFGGEYIHYIKVYGIGQINGLQDFSIFNNPLNTFNPKHSLPITLTRFELTQSSLTTASYTEMEEWANAQPPFTNNCIMYFYNNINSITGTNLEAILLTKNVTIYG